MTARTQVEIRALQAPLLAGAAGADLVALGVDACFRRIIANQDDAIERRNLRITILERHQRELQAQLRVAGIGGWKARTRAQAEEQDARIAYYAKALAKVERRLANA